MPIQISCKQIGADAVDNFAPYSDSDAMKRHLVFIHVCPRSPIVAVLKPFQRDADTVVPLATS